MMTAEQEQMMERILGRPVDSSINVLPKYRSEKSQDTGAIEYDAGKNGKFKKSSRFVYVSSEKRYGEISMIFTLNDGNAKETWFEINMFLSHSIDGETCLPYAKCTDSNRYKIITREEDMSRPLIVGLDGIDIWFISIPHDSNFEWLNDHVNANL